MAQALREDFAYLRNLISNPHITPADVRRASAIVRRLLVDRDLTDVAAPRIGQFFFSARDLTPTYEAEKHCKLLFSASQDASLFGIEGRGVALFNCGQGPGTQERADRLAAITSHGQSGRIKLNLSKYLHQRVLCFDGKWATREDALRSVANKRGGVHSGAGDKPIDKLMHDIRYSCAYRWENGGLTIHVLPQWGENSAPFHFKAPEGFTLDPEFVAKEFDAVMLEVTTAAHSLVTSEQAAELEAYLERELGPL